MTAINIIRADNSTVHIVTDGAEWFRDGTLAGFGSKISTVLHLSMAVCGRGQAGRLRQVTENLTRECVSFDAVADEAMAHLPGVNIANADDHVQLFLIGWSDRRQRFDVHFFDTESKAAERLDGEGIITPAVGGVSVPPPECGALFDDALVELVKRQRRVICDRGHSLAGGFVQLTTITRAQIVQRILHQWPDKIGERIAPEPDLSFLDAAMAAA